MNTTVAAVESTPDSYDDRGAMMYIVVVLLWYSVGIIFMLGMQMRARSETIEESARRRTKRLIRNIRDHTNTKEILEELVDKQKRARLWDIYLDKATHTKDMLARDDSARIRHIEKQLATLNRHRRLTNGTLFASDAEARYFRSRSDSRQVLRPATTAEPRLLLRRRSSLDQQTLERWKALANQSKVHETMPWTIRKLLIRRHFRQPYRRPLPVIHQESHTSNPLTDSRESTSEHTQRLARHQSDVCIDSSPSYSERQNPYLTYFYAPSHRPRVLDSDFFAVSAESATE